MNGDDATGAVMRIAGTSPAAHHLRARIEQLSYSSLPLLISGESGSGKEHFARVLHQERGCRPDRLRVIDCRTAYASQHLFSSTRDDVDQGVQTLVLKHIECLPAAAQAELASSLDAEANGIEASGRPRMMTIGTMSFSETSPNINNVQPDLLYAIAVNEVRIPALRERPEDISSILAEFLDHLADENLASLTPILMTRPWSGNVRELRSLSLRIRENQDLISEITNSDRTLSGWMDLFEKRVLESYLIHHRGNIFEICQRLKVSKTTIYGKLKQHGLGRRD